MIPVSQGGDGHWATFTVIKNETDGTVKLQNEKRPERYLAIRKCGLTTVRVIILLIIMVT